MRFEIYFVNWPGDTNSVLVYLKSQFPGHEFVYGNRITVVVDPNAVKEYSQKTGIHAAAFNVIFSTNPPSGKIVLIEPDVEYLAHEIAEYTVGGWDFQPVEVAVQLARAGINTYVDEPSNDAYVKLKSGAELRGTIDALKRALELLRPDEIASMSPNLQQEKQQEEKRQEMSFFDQYISMLPQTQPKPLPETSQPVVTGEIAFPELYPSFSFPSMKPTLSPATAPTSAFLLLLLAGIFLGVVYFAHK